MKIYLYQKYLLELYRIIGLDYQKTPVIFKRHSDDTQHLQYLLRCGYVEKRSCPFEPRNRSDRMATWWKITLKGILLLSKVFGNIFKEDDIPTVTDMLLTL